MNVGVLGGTFDPLHLGHLVLAEEARGQLGLERVLFVPAREQWLKAGLAVSPVEDRVEMVQRGIAGNPHFRLSRVEVDRPGPSYTADTMEILQRELGEEARLFFLLGWDSLADLPRWRQPERLLRACTLAAFPRPGVGEESLARLEATIPSLSGRLVLLKGPQVDISGTEIRRRVAAGGSLRYLVPEGVEAYIRERGLYQLA